MKPLLASLVFFAGLLSGCVNLQKSVEKVPPFSFETWTHTERYGLFTANVNVSGADWVLNPDGSADATFKSWDIGAAWAGAVGPHDVMTNLKIHFPATSPQAQSLARGVQPPLPRGSR